MENAASNARNPMNDYNLSSAGVVADLEKMGEPGNYHYPGGKNDNFDAEF